MSEVEGVGAEPRHARGHRDRRRAWDGDDLDARRERRVDEPRARVAHRGGARFGHERERLAGRQLFEDLLEAAGRAVLEVGDERLLDLVAGEQLHRGARILADNGVRFA
jgi:hypothetical protein